MPGRRQQQRVCFVTGSTGFVGLNLVARLLAEGWCVHALTRDTASSAAKRLASLAAAASAAEGSKLVLVEGELGARSGAELAVPEGTEVVFHLVLLRESFSDSPDAARRVAAGGLVEHGWVPETGDEHVRINLEAAEQVLAACARQKVRRVVFCSSWSAYGFQPPGTVVDEATPSLATAPLSRCG
jgi:nucleoside-diphosphate-sugar epimerase